MIQHIFKYIPSISIFNTKKVSSGPTNEGYYIGESTEQIGKPDILWTDICFIENEKLIWTHGEFYAQEQPVPTKTSELINDSSFITFLDISVLTTDVSSLDSSLKILYDEVIKDEKLIATSLTSLNASIEYNTQSITVLQNNVSTLDDLIEDVSTLIEDVSILDNSVNNMILDISALDTSMLNLYNNVDEIEIVTAFSLTKLNASINNNINDITILKNTITSVDSSLDSILLDISTCKNTITSVDSSLDSILLDISTFKNKIMTDVSLLDVSMTTIYNELENDEKSIVKTFILMDTSIRNFTENITTIQNNLTVMDNSINLNTQNITTKSDKIYVNQPTVSNSINISSNIYYKLGTISSDLTITLNTPTDENILNEYMLTFDVSGTPTITFPNNIVWLDNDVPTYEDDATYQISIIDNKAIYGKF